MSVALPACTDLRVRAGSKNWLRVRKSGIGASEIATALGIGNPNWGSPYELYMRKRGELAEVRDNADMQWGRALESTVLARFLKCHPEFREGPCITGRLYRSNERAWQLATPDAVVFDTRQGFWHDTTLPTVKLTKNTTTYIHAQPVVVQVKTARSRDGWGPEGSDEIPVYYRAQVLQEMDVVGADVAWVPVLFGDGRDYREYRVRRNERELNVLRIRGAEFWRRVEEGNPPPVDGSIATARALNGLALEPEKQVQIPADLMAKLARAIKLEERVDRLTSGIEARLREAMGDAEVAMVGDRLAAKRTKYTQRRFDVNRFREDHPELAEAYMASTVIHRLKTYTKEFK